MKVIPAMEEAFYAAQEGYSQGKFSFLDVLDAQRSLFSTKNSALDAMLDYHTASAAISRITGRKVGEIIK
jgi:cobalt-zinc-cadmium efflux system outer membrane protein